MTPTHPACAEQRHVPVGISGDDAKYTLAGSKVIVIMLNFPLQIVRSDSSCINMSFIS